MNQSLEAIIWFHWLTLCQQPVIQRMQALSGMIGRKASSAVKSQGSTLDRRRKLASWSTVGAEGISGGAVKCVEIGKNTNGEFKKVGALHLIVYITDFDDNISDKIPKIAFRNWWINTCPAIHRDNEYFQLIVAGFCDVAPDKQASNPFIKMGTNASISVAERHTPISRSPFDSLQALKDIESL
ncbi:hypothetical protein OSB04_014623 [Centaurea solstitialis]|uniref:Uncharacterized protein n=1 Tax=Centaurea solstitialis TaxID=347529 RepID=A0AA38T577_9ASTR|nr:hypothetical protein OSB04_014623 [Centaurea solstitialis]